MSIGGTPIYIALIMLAAIAVVIVGCTAKTSLRPAEPGFRYVHMNHDGTVRELSRAEQQMFAQTYMPGDGDAPYIKSSHDQRSSWGSLSGFIERRRVPKEKPILPVNPSYSPTPITIDFLMRLHEVSGDRITKTSDGFKVERGSVDPKEAMRRSTEFWLEHERAEEARAKPQSN